MPRTNGTTVDGSESGSPHWQEALHIIYSRSLTKWNGLHQTNNRNKNKKEPEKQSGQKTE